MSYVDDMKQITFTEEGYAVKSMPSESVVEEGDVILAKR